MSFDIMVWSSYTRYFSFIFRVNAARERSSWPTITKGIEMPLNMAVLLATKAIAESIAEKAIASGSCIRDILVTAPKVEEMTPPLKM